MINDGGVSSFGEVDWVGIKEIVKRNKRKRILGAWGDIGRWIIIVYKVKK